MPIKTGADTLKSRRDLQVTDKTYAYYSIPAAEAGGIAGLTRLPGSLKILLENMLRFEDSGRTVGVDDIKAFGDWVANGGKTDRELAYRPARILTHDLGGVPTFVNLAALRDAMADLGGDPDKINPLSPIDLVCDHSVIVDEFGNPRAFQRNIAADFARNLERYSFLKWGQQAFQNVRIVPPGAGICHQVNLEFLSRSVWSDVDQTGATVAYPDTCIGTDSHTPMVNAMAVVGWGVGGIEAEAAMLGQPISILIPEVIGFKLTGELKEGVTSTDLALKVVQMLRKKGVVEKFVEFYGDGLASLPLATRATISNMAPEYGATVGHFPIDEETLSYMRMTGRSDEQLALVEAYAKANGLWRDDANEPVFTDTLELDMSTVEPSVSGPKRPQDGMPLADAAKSFINVMNTEFKLPLDKTVPVEGTDYSIKSGSIAIAAITSCTNTSNPYVMIGAGLVAKKANELGLKAKPWVKTSLAPGSKVVTGYLEQAGLQEHLDALGFNLVGYGCTTCIGNSGALPEHIGKAVEEGDLVVTSVLSGNRNFEGRVNPDVKANYLASPPLVVAYAIAGDLTINLTTDPLGQTPDGKDVYLKDVWPSSQEINEVIARTVTPEQFQSKYADVLDGDENWDSINAGSGKTFSWPESTYICKPPYFDGMSKEKGAVQDVIGAKILAVFGDTVTTDHISPVGSFKANTPAGRYLSEKGLEPKDYNSYGSRRGNHDVMMRGTFANVRIKNEMMGGEEGGNTIGPDGQKTSIYDAAMAHQANGDPLVIVAGAEYGTGSSRDWAAKGTALLGVKAVIAESFERIHRANLVGMGVVPLQFTGGDTRKTLGITGRETITITGLANDPQPGKTVTAAITYADGSAKEIRLRSRIDTSVELEYVEHGGVLQYVLRDLAGVA